MKRARQALTFSAAIGAGLLAASAFAQQSPSPPPAGSPPPPQAQPAQQQTQPAPQAEATPQRGPRGMSDEDRSAFFDARIAAIHAGLKLTPDQERLWPPVESAVRDMARQMREMRAQRQSQAEPADPVERVARMGEAATRRGQALTRLAQAARPLYASLNDDQKRRFRVLMRERGAEDRRGMMDDRRGRRGDHDRMGRGGRDDRGDMHGMRGRERWDDDRRGGWNDWR